MIYRAIHQADAYLALTTYERDYLVARGVEADSITVVGPGVDPDIFAAGDGAEVRQRHGWGEAPIVAIMAKQTARKGFDLLLRAMSQVWRTYPEACLLLAGARTPYSERINALIRRLPPIQQERVTIVDDFAEHEKANLLSACDVFVLPSIEESFGIAFIEAWACGKPVIGVRAGAVPAVIDEGQDGLLVKDGDADSLATAIIEMLVNPERRAEMGRAGRRKVLSRYTWKTMTQRVRDVYQGVLSQQRR
jgi:glycosyltransferase involved in cell wall biosynthesis